MVHLVITCMGLFVITFTDHLELISIGHLVIAMIGYHGGIFMSYLAITFLGHLDSIAIGHLVITVRAFS